MPGEKKPIVGIARPLQTVIPAVNPTIAEENSGFLRILQGTPTNELSYIATSRSAVDVDLNDQATIRDGVLTVFLEQYSTLTGGLKQSTVKLLQAGIFKLSAINHYGETREDKIQNRVMFSLDEYMDLRGLKDRKEARKQIRMDLETIYNASIEWTENSGKAVVAFDMMRICYRATLARNGNIEISFSPELARYLINSYVMYLPRLYWLLNDKRNPNSSTLLYKLTLNQRINRGRAQAYIISVKSLLSVCAIPTYDELGQKAQVQQRIIEPFERDLRALEPTLQWEYCNSRGKPLTKEQLEDFSYALFSGCYIKYDLPDSPERDKHVQAIEERTARKKSKAKTKKGEETLDKQEEMSVVPEIGV